MRRLDRVLTWVENVLAAGSLAAATALAVTAVLLRQVFNHIIFWSEEMTIFLIIFSTFFGAVVTLRHNEHVNIDILPTLVRTFRRGFAVLASGITVVYCALIGFYAWLMVFDPIARNTVTPALKFQLWVVEIAVPVGLTLMFLRALEMSWRVLRGQELASHVVEPVAIEDDRPEPEVVR
ncbi:MAG TPA: TRAP transporter small permease [Jiangellales bacterium]|nr:TRAP transporter small permease [Jiangellales bacterium]